MEDDGVTREQQFEQHLAEWIEEGPFLAPDRALEAAFAHADAHPRRRFPLAGPWRSALGLLRPAGAMPASPRQSRISAFAAIGAAAVLFVGIIGGSAVLLTANRGGLPPAGPVVPASPTPTTGPTSSPTPTPIPFASPPASATLDAQCKVGTSGTETTSGGVTRYRSVKQACPVTSSDPRLEGSGTSWISIDERADGSADIWGSATIATEDGTWSGPWRGSIEPGDGIRRTEGLYVGSGAYKGLRYRYTQTSEDGLSIHASGMIEAVDALPARATTLVHGETCYTAAQGTHAIADGVEQFRDMVMSCGYIQSSDPRAAAATERVVINIDKLADGSATMWGTATIENDGGTWSGSWTGTVDIGYRTHRMEGTYSGAGGYAGLEYRWTKIGEQYSPFILLGTIAPAG